MPLQPLPFNIYQQKSEFLVEILNGTAQSSENFPEEMEILRNPRTGKFLYHLSRACSPWSVFAHFGGNIRTVRRVPCRPVFSL